MHAPSITIQGQSEPFELQLSRGHIENHTSVFRFGWANAIGTTPQTITAATATGVAYAYPAAAATLKVSSSSANDTAAGTGARTLLLAGLDANYAAISEVITLNGQTQVTTTNSYLRVTYTELLTTGSGNAQAGSIYVGSGSATAGVPTTIYWQAEPVYNNWSFAGFTVPAGYTAYISSYTITSQSTTANVNVSMALAVAEFGKTYIEYQSTARLSSNGTFDRHFDYPLAIDAKSDVELRAWASTTGVVNVTGEIQYVLVQTNA